MPLYEFSCKACNRQFEVLFSTVAADAKAACMHCGSTHTVKLLSVFAATSGQKDFACNAPGACPVSHKCGGSCPHHA